MVVDERRSTRIFGCLHVFGVFFIVFYRLPILYVHMCIPFRFLFTRKSIKYDAARLAPRQGVFDVYNMTVVYIIKTKRIHVRIRCFMLFFSKRAYIIIFLRRRRCGSLKLYNW